MHCLRSKKDNSHQDFNGSPGDLGGDGKSLEERGLLGSQAGVDAVNVHINWCEGTSLGWGSDLYNTETV